MGDGRGGDEEAPRDLLGRQPAENPKCERDACVLREDRMAGHEDEPEEVVPHLIVDRRVHLQAFLSQLDIASDLFVLAL